MKTATYLEFNSNAREVIEVYKRIFDAEVVCEYLFDENMTKDQSLFGKVFHAELKIGDLNLYLSDSGKEPTFDSIKFVVEVSDEEEARMYFTKLVEKGKLVSDFTKMPFGPTIAHAVDEFGIHWNIVIC